MARLRRSSAEDPGWSRRRAGRGFVYLDHGGLRLSTADADRVKGLVIPPAWRDVWICPWPNGHLQAVGTDDAGRRQYLYHPDWRTQRDALKHARVLEFGRVLPRAREQVLRDLGTEAMTRERASAVAVRLLDLGYFRIGNDVYVDEHGSFGLTTMQRRHVRRTGDRLVFCFVGKSGVEHTVEIDDPDVVAALEVMRHRRAPAKAPLLVWKDRGRWHDLDSGMVNDYIRETTCMEATAKDFRTWHATVIAAASLAASDEPGSSRASRKRAEGAAMKEVAEFLGNTPALARSSYVDPRVVDAYEEGRTIASAVRRSAASPDGRQALLERAVLRLLRTSDPDGTTEVAGRRDGGDDVKERSGAGRDETPEERLDRNWNELLQELRITQTGLQLLSGFLLTLAFTQRFAGLATWQQWLYLGLVVLAALALGLNLTPVMLHRRLFGEHVKARVVETGHLVSQLVIALVALLVTGTTALIFSVVLDATAALVVSVALGVVLGGLLAVLPGVVSRRVRRS